MLVDMKYAVKFSVYRTHLLFLLFIGQILLVGRNSGVENCDLLKRKQFSVIVSLSLSLTFSLYVNCLINISVQ